MYNKKCSSCISISDVLTDGLVLPPENFDSEIAMDYKIGLFLLDV
jgi:hypothetical protein